MSSAANHRVRSHKSQSRHMSAMSGSGRRAWVREAHAGGSYGAPLIFRILAFRRAMSERRRKSEVVEAVEA